MIRVRAIKEMHPNGLAKVDYHDGDFFGEPWYPAVVGLIDGMKREFGPGTWYQVFLNFLRSCKRSVFYPILTSFEDWNSAYSVGPEVVDKWQPQKDAIEGHFQPNDLSAGHGEPIIYPWTKMQGWTTTGNLIVAGNAAAVAPIWQVSAYREAARRSSRWLYASQMDRVRAYSISDLRALLCDVANFGGAVPGNNWEKSIAYGDRVKLMCKDYASYLRAAYLLPPTWYIVEQLPEDSWLKVLVAAGVLADGTLRDTRGTRCVAKDGHECLSLAELHIDNWLYANGICHEREPSYPKHAIYNKLGRLRADFKVGDIWIEYAGLLDDQLYAGKIEKKKEFAIAIGLNLIILEPSDTLALDDTMRRYGIGG